jgi:hypothetical protein
MYKGYYLVEQNFFDRCDGDAEVISNKSCDNIHRWNTFINCWGSLCLRHGNRCVVDGNTFIRPDSIINWAKVDQSIPIDRRIAGVRTYGDDQVIINNYFQQVNGGTTGLGVCVLASGDVDWTEDNYPAGDLSACNSADRDFVAFNTYVDCPRSSIDFNYSSGGNIPANEMMLYNNLIAARQGRNPGYLFNLPSGISAPTNCQWKGNMGYMAGTVTIGNYPGTFTTQQLRIADPKLIRTSERYTITPESPAVGAASSDDIPYRICVPWDIEGQPRTATSDVGCDQLSTVIRRNKVLTPEDVGPEAPEDIVTSAENNERNIVPASFALCQNYPNPFNPETVIRFSSDQNAAAELVVYNLIGEEIAVLFNEQVKSGSSHQVSFNAGGLPSGIYFYRLAIGGRMAVKKMVVMR